MRCKGCKGSAASNTLKPREGDRTENSSRVACFNAFWDDHFACFVQSVSCLCPDKTMRKYVFCRDVMKWAKNTSLPTWKSILTICTKSAKGAGCVSDGYRDLVVKVAFVLVNPIEYSSYSRHILGNRTNSKELGEPTMPFAWRKSDVRMWPIQTIQGTIEIVNLSLGVIFLKGVLDHSSDN